MSWSEISRSKSGKVYVDSTNPELRACATSLGTIHFGSNLDLVDLTPQKVDNASFDGWMITDIDWHYALGMPMGDSDGWVGFGGLEGSNWFRYRLEKVGYLHWPTRTWEDVGGAPDYNRANLGITQSNLVFGPNNQEIQIESTAVWNDIWTTPGGGSLSLRFRADPSGLKEDVIINQAAREWIAINHPPSTPINETWFGFVFAVDWSDISSVLKLGIPVSMTDFSDGREPITFRNGADDLLGMIPSSKLQVGGNSIPLDKRFWQDAGADYSLVGIRVNSLLSLPEGELRFDPTVDTTVPGGSDDGRRYTAAFSTTTVTPYIGYYDTLGHDVCDNFFRWTGVTMSDTITTAWVKVHSNATSASGGTPLMAVYGVDEDNPAAPTSAAEFDADALTDAKVDWDVLFSNDAFQQTPSLVSIFQELVNSYTISSDAVMIQVKNDGVSSGDHWNRASHYDDDSAHAAQLYVEYSTGGGVPPKAYQYKRRRI